MEHQQQRRQQVEVDTDDEAVAAVMMKMHDKGRSPAAPLGVPDPLQLLAVGVGNHQHQHRQQQVQSQGGPTNDDDIDGKPTGRRGSRGGSSTSRGGVFDDAEEEDDEEDFARHGVVPANANTGGRPSTAPARLIGLSIQTTAAGGSVNAVLGGGRGGDGAGAGGAGANTSMLGNVSSFDNDSLASPRSSRHGEEATATATATSTTVAAVVNGMAPLLTAPSKLEGSKSYDSSDDDLSRVLVFGGGGRGFGECGSDADISSSSMSRGGAEAHVEKPAATGGTTVEGGERASSPMKIEEGLNSRGRGEDHDDEDVTKNGGKKNTGDTGLDDPTEAALTTSLDVSTSASAAAAARTPTKGQSSRASAVRRRVEPWSEPPRSSKPRVSVSSLVNTASVQDIGAASQSAAAPLPLAHSLVPSSGALATAASTTATAATVPDGTEVFAIERILGRRYNTSKRRVEYLIVWKGFEDRPHENTWEPPAHLSNPSLNFVQRRWGDSKPSRTAAIEMTDSDLDEDRVRAFFEWEKSESQQQAAAAAATKNKKKPSPQQTKKRAAVAGGGVAALFEDGETTLTFGDGMADPKSFVKQTLLELVRKVRRKVDSYGFFSGPVDPIKSNALDYYDVIDRETEAMDLDTIEGQIKSGVLITVEAFEANLRRIVHCCRKYNTNPNHFVRLQAEKIEVLAAPMIDIARRAINKRLFSSSALAYPGQGGGDGAEDHDEQDQDQDREGKSSAASGVSRNRKRRRSKMDDGKEDEISDDDNGDAKSKSNSRSKSKRSRRSKACTPTPERRSSTRRLPTSGKKGFADADAGSGFRGGSTGDDSSALAKRPTRATRKSVDYSEKSARKTSGGSSSCGGDDESYSDSVSFASRSSISTTTASNRPKLDRNKYRDPAIPGSEVPPCKKDLSTSDVAQCSGRTQWLSIVPEMMNVCNEAARRATLDVDPNAERYEKPLSDVYMTERLEYDAVVTGYTCRTKASPHYLQGFVVITDFQVFRKSFRWTTSEEPAAGITPSNVRFRANDSDGSLTADLQKIKTRGAQGRDGIVFDRVAEVALLGGLHCGGKLLEAALLELRQSGSYDFAVLQATKMAIPFYERMGFVRVGAVCRFNDSQSLPEVSYRHWSEIVGNEAMEASYMMALRLQDFVGGGRKRSVLSDSSRSSTSTSTSTISAEEKRSDATLALRSACALLSDAAVLRALGTTASVHSLREMLALANDFAKCAGDKNMMKTIKRATNQCDPRSKRIGEAKMILRNELDLPIRGGGTGRVAPSTAVAVSKRSTSVTSFSSSSLSDGECAMLADLHHQSTATANGDGNDEEECSNVKVSVTIGGTAVAPTDEEDVEELEASVGNNSGVPLRELSVSIRVDGSNYEPKDKEEGHALLARLRLREERRNRSELKSATAIALQCLRDVLRDGEFLPGEKARQVPPVRPGGICMIRVLAKDGSPFWLSAQVRRHCKDYELPTDTVDASTHNSFIVKTVEADKVEEFSVCLDPTQRGVGRLWCTNMDWHSFQMMPPAILDELLIGSCVDYPLESGVRTEGLIMSRVGTGLQEDVPRWRLLTYDDDGDREHSFEYTAAALKEAVTITDLNLQKTAAVIRTLPPMAFDDGGGSSMELGGAGDMASPGGNGHRPSTALAGVNEEDINDWIQNRLEGCKLGAEEEVASAGPPKKKRRRRY